MKIIKEASLGDGLKISAAQHHGGIVTVVLERQDGPINYITRKEHLRALYAALRDFDDAGLLEG